MKPRILLVGATGVFGERLARRLATWPDIELVLAARSEAPLARLATALGVSWLEFDRTAPDLSGPPFFCVIDCAGPFQGSDDRLALAALAHGAHAIDIADGRAFVAGFQRRMDTAAKAAGRAAITGASSTPALSAAVLDELTRDWRRIGRVAAAISPGARAPQGLAVVRSILSWVGQPVDVFTDGAWTTRRGWSLLRRLDMPGLGRRWLSLAETPDLDQLVSHYHPTREALFLAGLESPTLHLGTWLAGGLVRLGLIGSLEPFARPVKALAGLISRLGSDRGGMAVWADGEDAHGRPIRSLWGLAAPPGIGPHVPTLPAQGVLRALLSSPPPPGAQVAAGLVSLDAILAEGAGLGLTIESATAWPAHASLFPRLMGEAFERLPPQVQAVHGAAGAMAWRGQARARGSRGLAALVRALAGIELGRFSDFRVEITPQGRVEHWRRRFGGKTFASALTDDPRRIGIFTEQLGPLIFVLLAKPRRDGFAWLPLGWRLGPLPLPRSLAPAIAARSFGRDGAYRFRVRISHPWLGLVVAYAGRLDGPCAPVAG